MTEAIRGADFIICGVSSFGVEWYRDEVLPKLEENVPMISVTKGLMNTKNGDLLTYLDIWQEKLDALGKKIPLNAIGGPCTSYELVAHDQTEVTFCGKDMDVLRMIKSAMATNYYHICLASSRLQPAARQIIFPAILDTARVQCNFNHLPRLLCWQHDKSCVHRRSRDNRQ